MGSQRKTKGRLATYKTKLKLDKEVGGGDLFELCTITYQIAYPYAWTVNFETCIDLRLTTHQPPIPKTSQAAAWSHKYIGYWNGETEGSPIGFATIFWGFETWNFPWAKVVHFEPLGALFGLGTPEAVLIDFVLGFDSRDVIPYSNEDPLDLKNPCRPRNHCNS